MAFDFTYTGVMGRARLGRFSFGRGGRTSTSATVPCPYIPHRPYATNLDTASSLATHADSARLLSQHTDSASRTAPHTDTAPSRQSPGTDSASRRKIECR